MLPLDVALYTGIIFIGLTARKGGQRNPISQYLYFRNDISKIKMDKSQSGGGAGTSCSQDNRAYQLERKIPGC